MSKAIMPPELNTVPEAVEAIRAGEIVIVVDAEDRENEGDYICAAEKATPQAINFMLSGAASFASRSCRTWPSDWI